MMMIYTTMVGSGSTIHKVDTIKYDRGIWLVPEWHEHVGEGYMTPARIVRLDVVPYQELAPDSPYGHFLVNGPMPQEALFGEPSEEQVSHYQIQFRPDIRVPCGNG